MRRFALGVVSLAMLLAAPGGPHDAPLPVGFVPPAGWTKFDYSFKMATLQIIGAWVAKGPYPESFAPNVTLGVEANAAPVEEYIKSADQVLLRSYPDGKITSEDQVTICESQPAIDQSFTMTMGGRRLHAEQIVTSVMRQIFIATYIRPDDQADDPGAQTALRTVCAPAGSGKAA